MIGQKLLHYEIVEKLGEGGMGVVYKARDTHLDRFVAIKVLPPEKVADAGRKARFVQEAKSASALNHPNIVTIHDIAADGGVDFIAMEYVAGKTLDQLIPRKGMRLNDALKIAVQIADALARAHAAEIVHRDLKPGNIMVDEHGLVKVLDFGLAKLAELGTSDGETTVTMGVQTDEGAIVGTAAYMSPEQAEGKPVDARSDIFSFGAVLYEMVTGRRAFSGFRRDRPVSLDDVPPQWQQIIARCLRLDLETRFQTAAELKTALEGAGRENSPAPSIAVLPFTDLGADKDNDYFSDGLTEDLINALAQLEGLRVVSRTTVFGFKGRAEDIREVGRKLVVSAVLEGTVRRAGNRLRVTAQLVNVADGCHLWSQRFDREMKDVFEIQDELTQTIVETLQTRLGRQERAVVVKRPVANLEAHELCLRGRYCFYKFTRDGFERAAEYFERARLADPASAMAQAWLAVTCLCLAMFGWGRPHELMPRAASAVQEALRIDPNSAIAHTAMAAIRHWYEWDWTGAEKEYRRGLELNPGDVTAWVAYAEMLAHLGRYQEAIAAARHAVSLEPVSPESNRMLGLVLFFARRYEEARERLQGTLEFEPRNYIIHLYLAFVYLAGGRFQDARSAVEQARNLTPGEPFCEATLAWVLAAEGERAEAVRVLDELTRRRLQAYMPAMLIAMIHYRLSQADEGYRWFETAVEERDLLIVGFGMSPLADPLHADPRIQRLTRKIGLEHLGKQPS